MKLIKIKRDILCNLSGFLPFKLVLVALMMPLMLIAQNDDIHSNVINKHDLRVLYVLDSLVNCDLLKAKERSLDLLKKSDFYDKPDFYSDILYRAVLASFLNGDITKSDSLYEFASHLSEKNIHPEFKIKILINQANAARVTKQFLLAIDIAKKAYILSQKNRNVETQLMAISVILKSYFDLGNFKNILEYEDEVNRKIKRIKNPKLEIGLLLFIGKIHIYLGDYNVALDYIDRAEEIPLEGSNRRVISSIYFYKGMMFYMQQNYTKAEQYFDASMAEKKKFGNLVGCSSILTYKAAISMRLKSYAQAEAYNKQARDIRKKAQNVYLNASSHYNIANSMVQEGKYDSALFYVSRAEELYSLYKYRPDLLRGKDIKQDLYVRQKKYKEAFDVLSLKMEAKDSLHQVKNKFKIEELEIFIKGSEYEILKAELQTKTKIQTLANQTNRMILNISLIIMVFLMGFGYLLYLYIREKNKKKLLVVNQQMIFIQMNSHFVFNALTAIQSLVYKKQVESTIHYLTLFSSLVKKVLFVTGREYVSLQMEVSFLIEYLQLQKLRFGDDLKFFIDISDNINTNKIQTPPLFLYPFIEYAVEECVQKYGKNSVLHLKISVESNILKYQLIDKGLGFSDLDKSYIKRFAKDQIMCNTLTKERISLYNNFFRKNIRFEKEVVNIDGNNFPCLTFKIRK